MARRELHRKRAIVTGASSGIGWHLAKQLADKAIFDGRNLYDPAVVKTAGLRYFAIGRGEQLN